MTRVRAGAKPSAPIAQAVLAAAATIVGSSACGPKDVTVFPTSPATTIRRNDVSRRRLPASFLLDAREIDASYHLFQFALAQPGSRGVCKIGSESNACLNVTSTGTTVFQAPLLAP